MDIKATLTKRIGPLPAWGWGAVAVGSIGVFLIMRKRGGGGAATGTQQDALGFGSSTGGGGGGGGGGVIGATVTPPGSVQTPGDIISTILPHDSGPSASVSARTADTVNRSWQPNAVSPISDAEEALIRSGRATSSTAAKIIANNLASTIEFASQQVGQSEQAIRFSTSTMGQTSAQGEAESKSIVSALTEKGYTASDVGGGQIIAAKTSSAYWNALNPTQQTALATWIQATQGQKAA